MPLTRVTSTARFEQPRSAYEVELLPHGVVRVSDLQQAPFTEVVEVINASEIAFADAAYRLQVQRAPEFGVNGWTPGLQIRPTVTPLNDGSVIVSWLAQGHPGSALPDPSSWSLWGRRFDAQGRALGAEFEITPCRPSDEAGAQGVEPDRLAATPDGGFVAVWRSQQADGLGWGIEAQRFSADGQPLDLARRVNQQTAGDQEEPTVAVLADGRMVVAWASNAEDGSGRGILMRMLDARGIPQGAAARVNTGTAGDQTAPEIVALAGGGFTITWNDLGGAVPGVRYQMFGSDARPLGPERSVVGPANAMLSGGTAVAMPDGGFQLVYESKCPWGCFDDIRVQRFDAAGQPIGDSIRINEGTLSRVANTMPQLAAGPDGGFVVNWASWDPAGLSWDARSRTFLADGTPTGPSTVISQSTDGQQSRPDAAVLADGRAFHVWQVLGGPEANWDIRATVALDPTGRVAIYTLLGDGLANVLDLPGAQIIDGGPGGDRMVGDGGNTVFLYDASDDLAVERPAGGTDLILSQASLALPPNVENARLLGTQPLRAWGNELGNSILGNDAGNLLDGRGGADSLDGGAGDDTLYGGPGNDTLLGGSGNDVLADGQGRNLLRGGSGDDVLDLRDADLEPAATLDGGAGFDTLLIPVDRNLSGVSAQDVERLDGLGSAASPSLLNWIRAQGIGEATNLTVVLDPQQPGGMLDISAQAGPIGMRGTHGGDLLVGNAQANRIELLSSSPSARSGPVPTAADSVRAGAGNDEIVWAIRPGRPALESFTQADAASRTYRLLMDLDGGPGTDRLTLDLGNSALDGAVVTTAWQHAWGEDADAQAAQPWTLDLTGVQLRGVEALRITGYDPSRPGRFPGEIVLSYEQVRDLQLLEIDEAAPAVVQVAGHGVIENRLVGTAGPDQIFGGRKGDVIVGEGGADTIRAGDGNDLVLPGDGDDFVAGGAGIDTVAYDGPASAYAVRVDALTRLITVQPRVNLRTTSDVDTLQDVERLRFADGTIDAPTPVDLTDAYRMFAVAFGSAPGATYMRQVVDAYDSGATTRDVVNAFVTKPVFTSVYPPSQPHQDFASRLVDDVVGATAAASAKALAVADIVSALDAGRSRGDVILSVFSNLASRDFGDPVWGQTARLLANKVAVARHYTEALGGASTDPSTLRDIISAVTPQTDISTPQALRAAMGNRVPVFASNSVVAEPVRENGPAGQKIFQAQARDDDMDRIVYSLRGPDAAALSIDPATGVVTLLRPADFETQSSYSFEVMASDARSSSSQSVRVDVLDVRGALRATPDVATTPDHTPVSIAVLANDSPADIGDTMRLVSVNPGLLGTAVVSGDRLVYTPRAGVLSGTDTLVYTVLDSSGAMATSTAVVTIVRVNDAPAIEPGQVLRVAENAPGGTSLGRVSASDQEGDALQLWAIVSSSSPGLFDLDASTGALSARSPLDFETARTHTIDVQVQDATGLRSRVERVVVQVTDANDAPTAGPARTLQTAEDTGVEFGVEAFDPDAQQELQFIPGPTRAGGSLQAVSAGRFLFTPAPNFSGTDTFNITVRDPAGATASQTFTVNVTPVNDAPSVPLVPAIAATEDTPVSFTVTAVDRDTVGPLSFSASKAANGTVTGGANGLFTYTPNKDFNGVESLTITVADAEGAQTTRTVRINIAPVDDPPVVESSRNLSTPEDTRLTFTVAASDPDEGDVLSYRVSATQSGTVSGGTNGQFTYTPNKDFNGTEVLQVFVSDRAGASATQTVTVTVNPVNDAPVAVADEAVRLVGGQTAVVDVARNDLDADGQTPTLTGTPVAGVGRAWIEGGKLAYQAPANYTGAAVVRYEITDGSATVAAEQSFTVVAPFVESSAPTVLEGQGVSFTVNGAPNTVYSLSLTGTADGGGVDHSGQAVNTLLTDGAGRAVLTLTTLQDKLTEGEEFITATLSGSGSQASVSLRDESVANLAPSFITPSPITISEDTARTFTVRAIDPNGEDKVTYALETQTGGTATVNATSGEVVFTPDENFNGLASVTISATDGSLKSTQVVSLTVLAVNDPPTVEAEQEVAVTEDQPATFTVTASDVDAGDTLVYRAAKAANGSITGGSGGVFTYTPNPNFNGTEQVIITVSDRAGASAIQTITFTVEAVNDAPQAAQTLKVTAFEDTAVAFTVTATDVDLGDTLTFEAGEAAGGTVTGGEKGRFTYAPNRDFNGTDTFVVTITDADGGTTKQTVVVTVEPINDPPTVTTPHRVATAEDTSVEFTVPATDVDALDVLTYIPGVPVYGRLTTGTAGRFVYTPAANFSGTDVVSIVVEDSAGATATVDVVFSVAAVNDSPTAPARQTISTTQGVVATFSIGASDVDSGDALSYSNTAVANGKLSGADAEGRYSYTPAPGFSGGDRAVFTITDRAGASATQTVDFRVGDPRRGTAGSDLLLGTDVNDVWLDGAGGNDTVRGLAGDDLIDGGDGDDLLEGGSGRDTLFGQAGDDTLDGGLGADVLWSDPGDRDVFRFLAEAPSSAWTPEETLTETGLLAGQTIRVSDRADRILQFSSGQDRLDVATANFFVRLEPGASLQGLVLGGNYGLRGRYDTQTGLFTVANDGTDMLLFLDLQSATLTATANSSQSLVIIGTSSLTALDFI